MGDLKTHARSLITLKGNFDGVKKERMELQEKLLADPKFKELLEKEKELEAEYAEERSRMENLILAQEDREKVEVDEGFIGVRPNYKVEISDGKKLQAYLKRKEGVAASEQFMERKWKMTKLKQYVIDQLGLGGNVSGVEVEEGVTISVNPKK